MYIARVDKRKAFHTKKGTLSTKGSIASKTSWEPIMLRGHPYRAPTFWGVGLKIRTAVQGHAERPKRRTSFLNPRCRGYFIAIRRYIASYIIARFSL